MEKLVVSTNDLFSNDDLLDLKTRKIAQELALALNDDSVSKIRELKNEYGNLKEFVKAKKFLDNKCKKVWNPFENHKLNIPSEAMKCLGITNQPSLDFLLGDSVKFFEKNNGAMTVKIIKLILANKNMSYTIKDIHNYLSYLSKKDKIKINLTTAQYLITEHHYHNKELLELGIDYKDVIKTLGLKKRIQHACQNIQQAINISRIKEII